MQTLYIHPDNPQPRLIGQVANAINQDKLVILPTENSYAFACKIGGKNALNKLKLIRQLNDKHQFTLLCQDISTIATYALVDNKDYKILKNNTPNPITFILNATKDVPRKLAHPKKKTIGIQVPSNAIAQAVLAEVGEALLTSSLILPDNERVMDDPFEIEDVLQNQVDLLVNAGIQTTKLTTIVNMTGDEIEVVRKGAFARDDLVI